MSLLKTAAVGGFFFLLTVVCPAFAQTGEVVVRPQEYPRALRNPLMGFRPAMGKAQEWGTLSKSYIPWRDIENVESDGVDKIRAYCDEKWKGVEDRNLKVIPRVYLEWPKRGTYWPADMTEGDYSSEQFQKRLGKMIEKMGAAWDNDDRVAFVEIGLIGRWGEHHNPMPSPEMQKLIGDAFVRSFKNKLLMNRYPWDFTEYPFGIYWDSFAHPQEATRHIPALETPPLADRWKTAPRGGEMAFDWGTPLGKDPTDAVANHADEIIAAIRRLHWNHIGWVSDYDATNPAAAQGGEKIQRALGYRFVIDEARYPRRVDPGKQFSVSFTVRNLGSSPLYYRWPVEISRLEDGTRRPVWKATFDSVDVRTWLPAEGAGAAPVHTARGTFRLPADLPRGNYIVALAILDPAGNLPSARFSIRNYFRGGRHPLDWIAVGTAASLREPIGYDDIAGDDTLHYVPRRRGGTP